MARILQIRRGTTAQNNNFTGMNGEITFDTDAKTLRVHDGVKLGGYELARADNGNITPGTGNNSGNNENPGGNNNTNPPFDINTVSDDFWNEMLNRLRPQTHGYAECRLMPLAQTTYEEYVFASPPQALFANAILVCVNPEAGYITNDEVATFGLGSHVVPNVIMFTDASGLHARLLVGSQAFWVFNKETGAQVNINMSNWRLKFRVYY